MQRLRLKADGRIVELRDGQEIPLATAHPAEAAMLPAAAQPAVRDLRRRARPLANAKRPFWRPLGCSACQRHQPYFFLRNHL